MNDTELRKVEAAGTAAPWHVTHYSGGVSFNGPPLVYAGTDPEYGEPLSIPSRHNKEADAILIAAARNALPFHLAMLDVYSEAMDQIGELTRSDADRAMNIAYDAMDEIDRITRGEK